MQIDLLQILSDTILAFVFFMLFVLIGRLFLRLTALHLPGIDNSYGLTFYSLVFGLTSIVCVYAIWVSRGVTINILIIPLLFFLVKSSVRREPVKIALPWKEILLVIAASISILHLLPESEYKQNDSLYYLKIAEAVNLSGQENTFHYSNLSSDVFHGTEPYHYFEIWCTALANRMSFYLYNGMALQRFVVQGIFVATIIFGLYNLVALQMKKLRYWHKLFCWSLVFFMPDIITYIPASAKYFISNIEGNLLERPNFRILYIGLVALLAEVLSVEPRRRAIVFWLLFLAIVSFKFTILVLPGLVIFGLYEAVVRKQKGAWWYVVASLAFGFAFGLFYWVTGVHQVGSFYASPLSSVIESLGRHWKFVLFSIAASLGYIVLVCGIFLLPFAFSHDRSKELLPFLRKNLLLIVVAISGVLVARILFIKDNAYQFLFVAHIAAFLLTWLIVVQFNLRSPRITWLLATTLFIAPAFLKVISFGNPPNIFEQNGKFVYGGKAYSQNYINAVTAYLRKNGLKKGVYTADSSFYGQLHYSRRNPNVYFLPISYVVAADLNGRIDFCISDSTAIMTGVSNRIHSDYLRSAVERSIFFQYRKQYPSLALNALRKRFISDYGISYLIATAGVSTEFADSLAVHSFVDPSTGERFIAFR